MLEAGGNIRLEQGEYRLVKHLEHGNQGQVWLVRETGSEAEFALKTLRIDDDPQITRQRSQRIGEEIAFLRALPDPEAHYIIPCLDAGHWEHRGEPCPAFIMPCYPERLSQHDRAPDGPTLLRWAGQLAEALDWLHSHASGTHTPIHRDLKPKNVLLTPDGDLRLIDFGIAKVSGGTGTLAHRDADYFAPEQRLPVQAGAHEGEDLVAPTAKSDLYCLGLILFQLAIGRSAVPRAQLQLREDRIRDDHLQRLQQDGRGLLGEIGGLTSGERGELQSALRELFTGSGGGTLVFQGGAGLPDRTGIAARLAEWVERLLAPAPDERPDAARAKAEFGAMQQALSPEIERITLAADPAEVRADQQLRLSISVQGSGLPAHGRWLELNQEGTPLAVKPVLRGGAQGFLSGRQTWDCDLTPLQDREGEIRLEAGCRVGGEAHRAEAVYRVQMGPEQLWRRGGTHRLEALRLDPRQEWLQELEAQARSTGQRARLQRQLQELQEAHPDSQPLERHIQNLQETPKAGLRMPALQPVVYALGALGALLVLGIGYWAISGDPEPRPAPKTVNREIGSTDAPPATVPPQPDAPLYERLGHWIQQQDVASIQSVIPELHCDPDAPDALSCRWLGYLYGQGLGVEADPAAARRHLQRAQELGDRAAEASIQELDALADRLLGSRDPDERARGYAIAEAAAAAGDVNAMLWMAYRYDRGDGVQRDPRLARQWYARAEAAGDESARRRLSEL